MYKSVFVMCLTAIFFLGCGSKEKSTNLEAESQNVVQPDVMKKFNQGIEYLDTENYLAAEKVFRKIVIENPTSQFHWIAMYNLGAAYEGLQKCMEAGKAYRKVAQASLKKYPRLEAQSLFRMSFAYSCIGRDEKAIAALLDARRRGALLQEEVALAEIPARLAAAYARIGNKQKAEQFFTEAKQGVQALKEKHKNRRAIRDILAKTLFLMGRMVPIEKRVEADPFDYLTTLGHLQPYLLEAVELNSTKWSPLASQEILSSYQNIWKLVKQVNLGTTNDKELRDHQKTQTYFRIASGALSNLKILSKDFRPNLKNNSFTDDLKVELLEKQKEFQNFLALNAIDTPLSETAKQREGLRREGKTTGETLLEQEATQRMKLPEKKPEKAEK